MQTKTEKIAMKSRMVMSLLLLLFTLPSTMLPALVKGTPVATPNGLVPIEWLNEGDALLSFNYQNKRLITTTITNISKSIAETTYQINANNEVLMATEDHLFFDAQLQEWVKAKDLTSKNTLVSCKMDENSWGFEPIDDVLVTKITKHTFLYEIELEDPHTFFIYESRILTHNYAIGFGLELAYGAGELVIKGITAGLSLAGIALAHSLFRKKSKQSDKRLITNKPLEPSLSRKRHTPSPKKNRGPKVIKGGSQAPGKPTEDDGFSPPKNWDGRKTKHKRGMGWKDKKGNIWVPSGPNGHGCPHWDVQHPNGKHTNIVPGGRRRGQK